MKFDTIDTMTRLEVAAALQVRPRTLRSLTLAGAIPAPIRVGARRVCWRAADIIDFLKRGGTPGYQQKRRKRGRPRKTGGAL